MTDEEIETIQPRYFCCHVCLKFDVWSLKLDYRLSILDDAMPPSPPLMLIPCVPGMRMVESAGDSSFFGRARDFRCSMFAMRDIAF